MSEHEEVVAIEDVAEERRRTIGGHGVGAIAEVHPHMRPIDVFRSFTEDRKPPSDEMMWGLAVEPVLLAWAAEKLLGGEVTPAGMKRSTKFPWLHSAPDAYFAGAPNMNPGLVSAKSVGGYRARFWGTSKTDHVPDYANMQEQLYMGLESFNVSYVVASVGGKAPELWAVPAHDRIFDNELELSDSFMKRYIIPGIAPPPDGSKKYKEWISEQLKQKKPDLIAVATGDEIYEIVERYREKRIAAERAKKELELADQCLRVSIGENEGLKLPSDENITFKANKKGTRSLLVPKSFKGAEDDE